MTEERLWDSVQHVVDIPIGQYYRYTIQMCARNGVRYATIRMWQFISDQWYPMHEGMKIPYIQPVAIYNNHDERTGSVLMEVLPKIIDALTHTLTLLPTLPVYDEHSAVPMPAALKYKKAKLATMEVEDTN